MAGQAVGKCSRQSPLILSFCVLLICLLPTEVFSSVSSSYSLATAAGWTTNVDQQQSGQGSGMMMTTFDGLWSFESGIFIPFDVKGAISNVQYTKGGSSQQLDLDSGLWLWRTPGAELILYGRWQYFHSSRLPADDFHGPAATLLLLTRRSPFLFHLAQDLQWSYFKRSVENGGAGTERQQGQLAAQNNQQMNLSQSKKRHEQNRRTRVGVDVQIAPLVTLSSDVSYAVNRATIARERWSARGASLALRWWPYQFWRGELWWQHLRTHYRETTNDRKDRSDTLGLRIDYQPGAWQYYAQWQWQRNKSSLPTEDYREQEITCGVIYHF